MPPPKVETSFGSHQPTNGATMNSGSQVRGLDNGAPDIVLVSAAPAKISVAAKAARRFEIANRARPAEETKTALCRFPQILFVHLRKFARLNEAGLGGLPVSGHQFQVGLDVVFHLRLRFLLLKGAKHLVFEFASKAQMDDIAGERLEILISQQAEGWHRRPFNAFA